MLVAKAILDDPNRIAAAQAAGAVPGDARNAGAIAGLRTDLTMGSTSTTPSRAISCSLASRRRLTVPLAIVVLDRSQEPSG